MPSEKHAPRRRSFRTVTLLACLALALPAGLSHARAEPVDAGVAARLSTLTNQMTAAIGEYHRATGAQRNAAAAKLKATAQQRRNLLLSSVERQPGLILQQSLPNGLTMGLPADVRDLIEQEVELTGHVGTAVLEDFRGKAANHTYFLMVSASGRPVRFQLHAADGSDHGHEHPAAPYVGQSVTVRAVQLDGQLLLAGSDSIQAARSTSEATTSTTTLAATISGSQSTLVLLGNLKDKALDGTCTASYVNNLMFGSTSSVNDLYRQTSNGNVTFSGPVYGPLQMTSASTSSTDFWAIGDEMDKLAAAQGIDVGSYGKTVYVIPQITSGYIGATLISVGSSGSFYRSWIMRCNQPDVYAHEIGHLIGFSHSSTPTSEYGDTSDIMGMSTLPLRHFSAPRRAAAGWLGSSRVLNVNGAGTFTIDANAVASPANPQALVLPKLDTNDSYFISLRQPIGYDTGLQTGYLNRVSVHRASTPGARSYLLATLGAGETYADSTNGYRFTVNSIGSGNATVSVDMPAPTCTRANPDVAISPVNQSGAPGKSVSYQITVTNRNGSGCGTSTFAFTPQLPSGWSSSNSPFTLSLGAGSSASSIWTVTSPTTGVVEQSYPVYLTTYDTAATTIAATVQGNYVVTTPDGTPPQVAIVSPANGSTVSGNVTVSASASDNFGVAKVEFFVNGALIGTDTSAPYSITWNTRKLNGTYTLTARAVDAAGNAASASSTVTVVPSSGPKRSR
jgi:hypothetical protein